MLRIGTGTHERVWPCRTAAARYMHVHSPLPVLRHTGMYDRAEGADVQKG